MSNVPPSCGDVSPTKSVFTVSNVGSPLLFARKNLPSLLDVPCSSLASVTAWSAMSAVATVRSVMLFVVTVTL